MKTRQPIRSIGFAALVVLGTNIAGGLLLLPVFIQLLLNTCAVVYIGCLLSTRLARDENGLILNYSKSLDEDESVIRMRDAKWFPVVASCFLFGIYLLNKLLPKQIFNGLINAYFSFAIVMSISALVVDLLPFSPNLKKAIFCWQNIPSLIQSILEIKKFQLSIARIISIFITLIPVFFYFSTKHWALSNVFGILFCVVGLKSLSLSDTKTGLFLLWALFFYDIFWVYGTDVMVTVAKNLDLPIKLLFPYLTYEGEVMKSMVGLGDIVLPGVFVSFCLKFDIDQAFKTKGQIRNFSEIELNYFNLAFVGYFYGIVETFIAMVVFEHPQPALLFLVPMCTLPVLVRAVFRGEFVKFITYDTELIMQEELQKELKEKEQAQEKSKVRKDASPPREVKRD